MLSNHAQSQASSHLKGELSLKGDKSISHRALILASLARGESEISNLSNSQDVLALSNILQAFGAIIEQEGDICRVRGVGNGCLFEPLSELDCQNSGTCARLMIGLVASYPITARFIGDSSLSKRPMARLLTPLKLMGAQILEQEKDSLPITIKGPELANPIHYALPVASAQLKSAILLAALNTPGITSVESPPCRDHSEILLAQFGVELQQKQLNNNYQAISLKGMQNLKPQKLTIAGDASCAAFLIVASLITHDSEITIRDMVFNEYRNGFIKILQKMNANITIKDIKKQNGETIATITARSSKLKAIEIAAHHSGALIDEYPILAIAAAFANGESKFYGLKELRFKESDRLSALAQALKQNGISCQEGPDYLFIRGQDKTYFGNVTVNSYQDHRIAMSFLIFGLRCQNPITVSDSDMIKTSFRDFITIMQKLNANISEL